ncbi:MAG TPA: hypothetical protein VFS02_12620 [Telluria sp.]|nr:hypothetical protein [Telluria sp.]
MPNIAEAEARLLLSRPLHCEGAAWTSRRHPQEGHIFSAGLLDDSGSATSMFVELAFIQDATAARARYIFSVFLRKRYGQERVYQLDVIQESRRSKDTHRRSHEHIGDLRLTGPARWDNWSYHEVLNYFCAQTNIIFDPVLPSPK